MRISILKISDLFKNEINEISKYISEEKNIRVTKFQKKDDKIRGICSELLIRKMIIDELKIDNGDIVFEFNKYGKPFLKGRDDIYFNTSHSGEYVVCCLDNKPIGIDVEMIKNIDFEGIVENFFTPIEKEYILNKSSLISLEESINRFYEVWTLKESFIKCIGKGLSMPLNKFSIYFDEKDEIRVDTRESKNIFSFKEIVFDSKYKISICSQGNCIANEFDYIIQNQLIKEFILKI